MYTARIQLQEQVHITVNHLFTNIQFKLPWRASRKLVSMETAWPASLLASHEYTPLDAAVTADNRSRLLCNRTPADSCSLQQTNKQFAINTGQSPCKHNYCYGFGHYSNLSPSKAFKTKLYHFNDHWGIHKVYHYIALYRRRSSVSYTVNVR